MHQRTWAEWPTCKQCGHRRQTKCPVCHVAGNVFSLAEYLAPPEPLHHSRSGSGSPATANDCNPDASLPDASLPDASLPDVQILLHCPQCDEVFAPCFYRHCPECGHDAGEGIEIRQWQPEPLSDRELLAIVSLVLIGLGTLAYFWALFH